MNKMLGEKNVPTIRHDEFKKEQAVLSFTYLHTRGVAAFKVFPGWKLNIFDIMEFYTRHTQDQEAMWSVG